MNIISKELIPDKEWIVTEDNEKIGSLSKNKKGFFFKKNGQKIPIKNLNDIGIIIPLCNKKIENSKTLDFVIYNYPCSSKPFSPVYNIKKRLPLFTKSSKSKSQFCAGYYLIKFKKGWVKSFCPKLITLERNLYKGPFRDEKDLKAETLKIKL